VANGVSGGGGTRDGHATIAGMNPRTILPVALVAALAACTPTPPPTGPAGTPAAPPAADSVFPAATDASAPSTSSPLFDTDAATSRPRDPLHFPSVIQAGAAGTSAVTGSNAAPAVVDGADPAAPGAPCAGILQREGRRLVLDGRPVTLFGVNATMLMDPEVKEDQVEPIVAALAAREVNTVRTWYFHDEDPERFERLLDMGARHGVRFVVTLADNVFKGRDWFGGDEDEERYRPHLAETVARFKDRPEVLMWELINEPNCADNHTDECLDTIKGWLRARAAEVKAIDACHLVSTGMIGAGNYDNELTTYRRVHREPVIDVASAHRRSTDDSDKERATADEIDKPLLYGEIYDAAYTDGCDPQSDDALPRRAERITDDLRDAIEDGVAGYLLWDYAPGTLRRTGGKTKDYCNKFGFQAEDPLWARLLADPALPPAVPWRVTSAP